MIIKIVNHVAICCDTEVLCLQEYTIGTRTAMPAITRTVIAADDNKDGSALIDMLQRWGACSDMFLNNKGEKLVNTQKRIHNLYGKSCLPLQKV